MLSAIKDVYNQQIGEDYYFSIKKFIVEFVSTKQNVYSVDGRCNIKKKRFTFRHHSTSIDRGH